MSAIQPINIASVAFPNVFLRMDGSGVTEPTGPGAGTVNCQSGAGPWEQFGVVLQQDGSVAFESIAFPGVYLRMDGSGVTKPTDPGAGTVNCQSGAGPWEKYRLEPQEDGTCAFESMAFPGVYLRMDGNGVTAPTGPGAGTVNCQLGAGPWEKFHLETAS